MKGYCKICNKKLSSKKSYYCRIHFYQSISGKRHYNWKGGLPICELCRKNLSYYKGKRCIKCKNIGRKLPSITKNKIRLSVLKNPRKSKIIQIKHIKNWNLLTKKIKKQIYNKIYNKLKRKELSEYSKKYYHNHKYNLRYILPKRLRCRVEEALKRNKKSFLTMKLIGCSIEGLKQHLENQFKSGMSWKNYGKWHIDHIRPCASFDLSKSKEQRKCFHYSNLQPLWAEENLKKKRSNK